MDDKNKGSAFKTGLVAATLGAAAGAAAVLLTDKSKRDQMTEKARELKDKATAAATKVQKGLEMRKDEVEKSAQHAGRAVRGKHRQVPTEIEDIPDV